MERALEFAERFEDSVPVLAHVPREGHEGRRMLALVDHNQLRQILTVMLDEDEFLSPHGIRSISRRHLDDPYEFDWAGQRYEVRYEPAESDSGMFGGNSNWRGPVWFPMNLVILRALFQLHRYYGDEFTIECPTGSGQLMNLREVALEISRRLISTFERGEDGKRPVYGGLEKFQDDPHWRDLLLFHEYFHGDNGAGLGASHQTGWTGTVRDACSASTRRRLEPRCRSTRSTPPCGSADTRWPTCPRKRWDAIAALPRRRRVADGRVASARPRGWRSRSTSRTCRASFRAGASADLRAGDVIGSPYCVRDYVVDERFGGRDGLARRPARARRARAAAHPRLRPEPRRARPSVGRAHPEYFIRAEEELAARPATSAHGERDRRARHATRTSRRGRTSSSSTRSRPSCARRWPRRWSTSARSATGCAATWRC